MGGGLIVERGFLSSRKDLEELLEGIELARSIAATAPLAGLLARELEPGDREVARYVRETIRNDFHPRERAGSARSSTPAAESSGSSACSSPTLPSCPRLPRASTSLTTAAIAERIAETL